MSTNNSVGCNHPIYLFAPHIVHLIYMYVSVDGGEVQEQECVAGCRCRSVHYSVMLIFVRVPKVENCK